MVLTNEVQIFPTTTLRFENEKTSVKKQVFTKMIFQDLQTSEYKVRHLDVGGLVGWLMRRRRSASFEGYLLTKTKLALTIEMMCL